MTVDQDIDVKIDELPAANRASDDDQMEVSQAGKSRRMGLKLIRQLVASGNPIRPLSGYTAQPYDVMAVSTAEGPVILRLPAEPKDLQYVTFIPLDDSWGDPNLLIIDPQGQPVNGLTDILACDVSYAFRLLFTEGTGWHVWPESGPPGPTGAQGAPGAANFSRSYVPPFVANAYAMQRADIDATFTITTGATDQTITLLDVTGLGLDGHHVAFNKVDTGTGVVVIKNPGGGSDNTHLMTIGDFIRLRVNGDSWTATDTRLVDVKRVITSNTTWLKRPRLTRARFFGTGGGGGGGSGRRGAPGSARSGGGGGAVGAVQDRTYQAVDITASSYSITMGADSPGGAAVTTDDTSGNPGTAGNDILIVNFYRARGGGGGQAGGTTAAGGTTSQTASDRTPTNNSGGSSITAAPAAISPSGGPGPGGGGAGLTTGNVGFAGAGGGGASISAYVSIGGGAGGTIDGGNAGNGGNGDIAGRPDIESAGGGAGGGGGGSGPAVAGGSGGNGGNVGGGGGGGAASANGFTSGAGGIGRGPRLTIIETYAR
jgi:hypothetical protein